MMMPERLKVWRHAYNTANLPIGMTKPPDAVSKWLVITRAAVFSMTVTSGLIGGLLAIGAERLTGEVTVNWGLLFVAVIGLVVAHVAAFALGGLFVSVFYVAPPIRLKHIGLGEPGVFIVWGPLMVVGTFYVASGQIPAWTWIASLPYAILVTTVLFGKHIDKIEADTKKGVRTMPVILGEERARLVAQILMVAFYPIVVIAALVGWIGPWVALVVLGIPRLLTVLKTYSSPRHRLRPTRAGRCGSSATHSSTRAGRVAC